MYLTVEILKKNGACGKGLKWFERTFPNGAELVDVMSHKYVTPHFLHWGYESLYSEVSEEEKQFYWNKLKINCEDKTRIFESVDIKNSNWVSESFQIVNSEYVFNSSEIASSQNILGCKNIQNSSHIFESEFIYDSKKIFLCKNVTNSHNITSSNYVINSHSINNATSVTGSTFVTSISKNKNSQIKNSHFISDCQNIKYCLFCREISDAEFMIFNKKIDQLDYENILKQLDNILKDWEMELVVNNQWPENTIPITPPIIQRNIIKQYANLPDTFWRWIKTLPYYDPQVIYSITYNPKAFD